MLNKDEQNQKGIHTPQEGRPKAPERGRRRRRDESPSSCHEPDRSEAEDTLTMISHGVEIAIAGGGADEKDEKAMWGGAPRPEKEILAQPLPSDSYPSMNRISA